ncbi:MAG: hypothetical protein ACOYK9_06125 [Chlamydiia bacterium]
MLNFAKYVAAGNDFIVCETLPDEIPLLCDRRKGIGADGLIWLEGDRVHFYNSDGSKAFCCGNGLRIAAVHSKKTRLFTALGEHAVEFTLEGCRVTYPDPRQYHQVIETLDPGAVYHPPQNLNKNYVKVLNSDHILMKTIERGCGETPSCGSGAISTLLTLLELKKVSLKICAEFTSGEKLWVEKMEDGLVWLEGPVHQVFTGQI